MKTTGSKPTDTQQALELLSRAYDTPAPLTGIVLTYTQQAAIWYYDTLNLNVFPQVYGQKRGIPWKRLQYTRLDRYHPNYGLLAAFQGRSNIAVMVGVTSGNLFDFDSESIGAHMWVREKLRERNIPIWAFKTSRGGHHFLRCSEGTVKSIAREIKVLGLDIEVRGHTGYVLAPPSVNTETGVIYDWEERQGDSIPVVSINQIDFLPIPLELTKKSASKPFRRDFMLFWNSTREYLKNGHLLTEGQRHTAFFNAAVDYGRNKLGRAEIERDLVPIAQRGGLPDDADTGMFDRVITWVLNNNHKWTVKRPRVFDWQRAEAFVSQYKWQGRKGNTDRAVALGMIERAKSYSNDNGTFRASYREIGLLARISNRQTLFNSLERLKAIPFITWAGNDSLSKASLWHFSDKSLQPINGTSKTFDRLQTDALENGALGQSGSRVWQALLALDKPAKLAEIARETGLSTKQVSYALRTDGWLRQSELVKRVSGGWIGLPATAEQLDESVARPAGKLGKGKQRQRRFQRDRAVNAGKVIVTWRKESDRENFYV